MTLKYVYTTLLIIPYRVVLYFTLFHRFQDFYTSLLRWLHALTSILNSLFPGLVPHKILCYILHCISGFAPRNRVIDVISPFPMLLMNLRIVRYFYVMRIWRWTKRTVCKKLIGQDRRRNITFLDILFQCQYVEIGVRIVDGQIFVPIWRKNFNNISMKWNTIWMYYDWSVLHDWW